MEIVYGKWNHNNHKAGARLIKNTCIHTFYSTWH